MRRAQTPPPRDPDFDRVTPPRRGPTRDVVRYYQRLVLNPFLAVIAGCVTYAAASLNRTAGWVLPIVTIGVIGAFTLLQYHCLDCGATGRYARWKHHACPRVCDRWSSPFDDPSLLFPSPTTQLVFWNVLFLIVLMLLGTSGHG